jgi:hypothetical protein
VRDIRIDPIASQPCGMSGGRLMVIPSEPQEAALDPQSIIAWVRAWGFEGFDLVDMATTIFKFEEIYLTLSRARAAERMKQWNR